MHQRLSQNGCSCGTVTSNIISLLCNFLNEFCTNALVWIFQINFLRNGYTIVGNSWSTISFVKNNIATLWSQSYLYSVCQLIKTSKHTLTCFIIISNNLCHDYPFQTSFLSSFFKT